jgi:uncharacterized protein YjbJ (UPF0337 family)
VGILIYRSGKIIIPSSIEGSLPWQTIDNEGTHTMNSEQIEGQLTQQKRKVIHHFRKMMNDKVTAIMGKYDNLVKILQEKYSNAQKVAVQKVDALKIIVEQLRNPMGS